MRKILYLAVIALALFRGSMLAQDTVQFNSIRAMLDNVAGVFKTNHPGLSFFKYHLFSTDGNVYDFYKGKNDGTDSVTNFLNYFVAVQDVELSNFNADDTLVKSKRVFDAMVPVLQEGMCPLSLMFVEYDDFKDSTLGLGLINFDSNRFTEIVDANYNPFAKRRLFTGSALNHVIKGGSLEFLLTENLIQSNIRSVIGSVAIDFGDEQGFIPITIGVPHAVNYTSKGLKNCVMRLQSDTGYFYSTFQIYDSTSVARPSSGGAPNIGPNLFSTTYNGNTIVGKYAIWLAPCHNQLTKPFIIGSGFNPGNGKQLVSWDPWPQMITMNINGTSVFIPFTFAWRGTYYDTYNGVFNKAFSPNDNDGNDNGNKMLDRLRDEGYDIVIFNNVNGTDFIQHNAALCEALITIVNTLKVAGGRHYENVVCGVSAGGLSSRMALAKMESKYKAGQIPHPHTKLWVSLETENQGAVVPIGFQYLVNFQANPGNVLPTMGLPINILQVAADNINRIVAGVAEYFNQNDATSQLHSFSPSSPNGPQPNLVSLTNEFNSIPNNSSGGYPEFVRRVGIAQGSGRGIQVPHNNDYAFTSQLKMNPFGDSYTENDCNGSYTVYRPVAKKTTVARWWGSAGNGQNVFDGDVMINANWTIMKRQCTPSWWCCGLGCQCIGPFIISGQVWSTGQHVPKPPVNVAVNVDDAPGSTQNTHQQYYNLSAYPFYNSWFAGNSNADADDQLHNFAPTVSCLDLHDPNNGYARADRFTDVSAMGLMTINNDVGLTQHPDKRFGFPYLQYPSNHYQITPFDAVYAIGNNNVDVNNNPKPDNHYHVEDAQTFIGDYVANVEVAPTTLYMTNQIIGNSAGTWPGYTGGYVAEFEARDRIVVGKTNMAGTNLYKADNYLYYMSPYDNVSVAVGSKAIIHAGLSVELLPGFETPVGAELDASIEPYTCQNLLNKPEDEGIGYEGPGGINVQELHPDNNPWGQGEENKFYPNPSDGRITVLLSGNLEEKAELSIFDISGKLLLQKDVQKSEATNLDLSGLNNGMYLLKVDGKIYKMIVAK